MDQTTLAKIEEIEKGDRKKAQVFFKELLPVLFEYIGLFFSDDNQAVNAAKNTVNEAYKNISNAKTYVSAEQWIKELALEEVRKMISPIAVTRASGKGKIDLERRTVPETAEECKQELLKQLELLDPCERAAVILNQYEHRSVTETAKLLHTDEEIVDTLLRHGRSRLDSLYLFELIEKLNPRSHEEDTLEIDSFMPAREKTSSTYGFTQSIQAIDETFREETKAMKPIAQRKERTYEEAEKKPAPLYMRIIYILILLAVCVLVWILIKHLIG